jgi:hypothetical protein
LKEGFKNKLELDCEGKLVIKRENLYIIIDSKDNDEIEEEIDLEELDMIVDESADVCLIENDQKERKIKRRK